MCDLVRRVKMRWLASLALVAAVANPTVAQDGGLGGECGLLDGEARERCYTVVQAVEAGQPQLGILIAGGNPTIGTASTQGLRFGTRGRLGWSLQVNGVTVRLPDILETATPEGDLTGQVDLIAPALASNLAIGVLPGFDLSPQVGGVGSVDLLLGATWLPFSLIDAEGFERADNPDLAYGAGLKVGLLRESFVTPGASISLMFRRLGNVSFGDVCPSGENAGICAGSGDVGEFAFDLTDWSARAAVSKRMIGFGLTGGIGYDRFESDLEYAFRFPDPTDPAITRVFRRSELQLESDRWSAFVNASYTMLIATLGLEAGWMQGNDAIPGFDTAVSDFDPADGTWFGSVGLRISF